MLLDPYLCGVRHPNSIIEHADNQGDVLTVQHQAPPLQQLCHPVDIVRAAGDAGPDQTPCRIKTQLVMVDHSGGVELLCKALGCELVGAIEPLAVSEMSMLHLVHDGPVLPADCLGQRAPDVAVAL